jgi:multidrug resistance efflux pump
MGRSSSLHVRGRCAEDDAGWRGVPQFTVLEVDSARGTAGRARWAGLDVAGGLIAVRNAFARPRSPQRRDPTERTARLLGQLGGRHLLKMLIGLAIVLAAGFLPVRAFLETASGEAMINAHVVTLRAPIDGDIAAVPDVPPIGTQMQPGALVLRILNRGADRGRLDGLRRLIDRLEGERNALIIRRDGLEALHAELLAEAPHFKSGRTRRLKQRMAEPIGKAADAAATGVEAAHAVERSEASKRGARRVAGGKARRNAAAVAQRLSEVTSAIDEHEVRLGSLRSDLGEEIKRLSRLASAELIAPVRSTVWENLTAPDQSVVRGQDLVRLLDCSELVATAAVGASAYNRLRIGDPARFRLHGESADYQGRIIGLSGVATAPANLAIQPAGLAREAFRVTVALPGLTADRCAVGRTGRVTFAK